MKLWFISQTVNNDYDTYSGAVVTAETEEKARLIHPGGVERAWKENKWQMKRADGSWFEGGDTWASPSEVKAEYIGDAKRGTKTGVICVSFHAG